MVNRGNSNLDYETGFKIELDYFNYHKNTILKTLQASKIELTTRGLLDKVTGTDATALIDGMVYGISLRFRNVDYNSFTLNRHITDPYSEVHKWLKPNNLNLKPAYYIQLNKIKDNEFRLIKINIDAFAIYLQHLINTDNLEKYYKGFLEAYEFDLNDLPDDLQGYYSKVFTE